MEQQPSSVGVDGTAAKLRGCWTSSRTGCSPAPCISFFDPLSPLSRTSHRPHVTATPVLACSPALLLCPPPLSPLLRAARRCFPSRRWTVWGGWRTRSAAPREEARSSSSSSSSWFLGPPARMPSRLFHARFAILHVFSGLMPAARAPRELRGVGKYGRRKKGPCGMRRGVSVSIALVLTHEGSASQQQHRA
jgi:hypothetical protein